MTKKSKTPIKKWGFRGRKWVNGLEKMRVGNQNRKAKWCKMQALSLKIDKTSGEKGCEWYQFTYFLTNISPRTE